MKLTRLTEVYSQEEDCCGRPGELGQDIELTVEDGGGSNYVVIKTARWAVDDMEELNTVVANMLKRVKPV